MNQHLKDIDETYLEHARFAGCVAFKLMLGSLALFVHAVLPWLFVTTGSDTVRSVNQILQERREKAEKSKSGT